LLDICTVTYNSLHWLRIFTDHVFANTKDFKLYISDSGSTDGTVKYLKKLRDKYPDIVKYRATADNHGWTKGVNWGVSQGNSPDVLICNPDIILPEKWFDKMSAHFSKGVGAVGPVSDIVAGRQDYRYCYGQYEDETDLLIGFCVLTKRKILDKIGLLDEHYFYGHDDYDLSIRIIKAGYRLIIASDTFVKHFCFKSLSGMEQADPKLFNEAKEYTIKKHGAEAYSVTSHVRPTVVIGIPYWGDVDSDFVNSIIQLDKPGGHGAVVFSRTERTQVVPARNLIANRALEYNSQWLLFIDTDMVFGAKSLTQLLSHATGNKDISIIGGLAYKRRPPFEPCIFMPKEGNKWRYCKVPDDPGIYEVGAIGMGFTLIKTQVLKDLKKPYFKGWREDLNFCNNARKAGHRVFVDTTVQVGHLGERVLVDHYYKMNYFSKGE